MIIKEHCSLHGLCGFPCSLINKRVEEFAVNLNFKTMELEITVQRGFTSANQTKIESGNTSKTPTNNLMHKNQSNQNDLPDIQALCPDTKRDIISSDHPSFIFRPTHQEIPENPHKEYQDMLKKDAENIRTEELDALESWADKIDSEYYENIVKRSKDRPGECIREHGYGRSIYK